MADRRGAPYGIPQRVGAPYVGLRHRVAHWLGWNWCRHWAEDNERGHLVRWGFQCIGCGKVTVVRECRPSREEFVEVERSG